MRWKFWNRKSDTAEPALPDKIAAEPVESQLQLADLFLFSGSKAELLALQRLLGNQSVLRLLANPKPAAARKETPARSAGVARGRLSFLRFLFASKTENV